MFFSSNITFLVIPPIVRRAYRLLGDLKEGSRTDHYKAFTVKEENFRTSNNAAVNNLKSKLSLYLGILP